MKLLLDTHVLLWWLGDMPSLRRAARSAISSSESDVFVSAATVWEISIKRALGTLTAPGDVIRQIERHSFSPLPITLADAWTAGTLPHHHDDPFDRMLVAQAIAADLTLVTKDGALSRYGVSTLLA